MKSLRGKIVVLGLLTIFLTSFIPSLMLSIITGELIHREDIRDVSLNGYSLLLIGLTTAIFAVSLFTLIINNIVIKRVKKVTGATKEVMKGDFSIVMKETGKDEVSELIHNFNLMIKELENTEYLNKEFVRNFSHEIKTPLSAIKGYAELLEDNTLNVVDKEEYLRIIISESDRLSKLSKNMLLVSQVDNQIIIPKNDTYNIAEQIRNIILTLQLNWEEKNISWDIDIEDIQLTTNKELLYQVFSNIIMNAIKYSPNNDHISIKLTSTNQRILCTISNTATLTKEECQKIFDLFYIKDKSRTSKSNGIGLYLTKRILEKLNGTITADSIENKVILKVSLSKTV